MAEESRSFRAPRGTYDLLPPKSGQWHALLRAALDDFARAGYEPVETPMFEHTEVFERGVGATSEVVNKQMYTFEDRAGRSLTLRPELTAGVVRAVLEHDLHRGPLPVKLAYASTMFRQERPQRGRYRQFWQVGIEALGADTPLVDAEVIEVGARFLRSCGVDPALLLNTIGHVDASCRLGYHKVLTEFLEANESALAPDDRARIKTNPLRIFDSKEERTIAVMRDAPLISDHICRDCRGHFEVVQGLLSELDVEFTVQPRLVRGLDYYTRTAFEFTSSGLGSQDAVGGGGRYDGLAEALGGPPLTGIGFSLGVDRILIARGDSSGTLMIPAVAVFFVSLGDAARVEALKLATRLRDRGVGADLDLAGRSMKGQMTAAARSGARWAAILGDEELADGEVTLKDLESGAQERVSFDDLVRKLVP